MTNFELKISSNFRKTTDYKNRDILKCKVKVTVLITYCFRYNIYIENKYNPLLSAANQLSIGSKRP